MPIVTEDTLAAILDHEDAPAPARLRLIRLLLEGDQTGSASDLARWCDTSLSGIVPVIALGEAVDVITRQSGLSQKGKPAWEFWVHAAPVHARMPDGTIDLVDPEDLVGAERTAYDHDGTLPEPGPPEVEPAPAMSAAERRQALLDAGIPDTVGAQG